MKKITFAIAGCGSRGMNTYAKCLEKHADRAEVVEKQEREKKVSQYKLGDTRHSPNRC